MPDPCTLALQSDRFMWEEIHDMPGEIYDLEQFREQTRELMALIDKCQEAEAARVKECQCAPAEMDSRRLRG